MAKEKLEASGGVKEVEAPVKKPRFRDTWQGFSVFIAVLLALRFLVFEPFKIPTGSMEPTLIGHEDYGDRIVTNKLAYKGGTNRVAFLGGDPKRFEVFVFIHDSAWGNRPGEIKASVERNYIKRVVGLPGEKIFISGGDLFLHEGGKDRILRKWEASEDIQQAVWQPVSLADFQRYELPAGADALQTTIARQRQNRAFPWDVDGAGSLAWAENPAAVRVAGPATLTYRYPATNLYVKLGRWPFRHDGCPAVRPTGTEAPSGLDFGGSKIAPYLPNYWSGVECPNCGQIRFPMVPSKGPLASSAAAAPVVEGTKETPPQSEGVSQPKIFPCDWSEVDQKVFMSSAPDFNAASGFFFYGGNKVVGDLKLEVELEVAQAGGALELEVGSNLHRAAWSLSLGGACPERGKDETRHDVPGQTTLEPQRKHLLTLAYVDGSVLSSLDGTRNEPVIFDVRPADKAVIQSLARIRLHGQAQIKITRLNLYRDLFYMTMRDEQLAAGNTDTVVGGNNDFKSRTYFPDKDRYQFEIPENKFLALGDNSPSSVDSRAWGFVPRENLVGRASFIFWPPARWRFIH